VDERGWGRPNRFYESEPGQEDAILSIIAAIWDYEIAGGVENNLLQIESESAYFVFDNNCKNLLNLYLYFKSVTFIAYFCMVTVENNLLQIESESAYFVFDNNCKNLLNLYL